ncbi:hypothetical protein RJ639_015061 [Escallonia herrerae]|uniref:Signal peptidase complex catalytic subunit SEC11 n=1 Tax=Escallonia herrerae TaxID=1293975 RepID=A0AA88VF63_9ASTE|nr:hypothetical protein RJ639_015061 [Escallonia herrerae]
MDSFSLNNAHRGVIITHALMLWKLWICLSGSGSPVVVVLTGSMEPGFRKGDVLFLYMNDSPIRSGEIVVFQVEGWDIPIVHRAIKVHQHWNGDEFNILTKGDNNSVDDRHGIYADDQLWLERNHIEREKVNAKSLRNPLSVISILAKDVSDLAFKEICSPILKRLHPLVVGVAAPTLHACYGDELKQFVLKLVNSTSRSKKMYASFSFVNESLISHFVAIAE